MAKDCKCIICQQCKTCEHCKNGVSKSPVCYAVTLMGNKDGCKRYILRRSLRKGRIKTVQDILDSNEMKKATYKKSMDLGYEGSKKSIDSQPLPTPQGD